MNNRNGKSIGFGINDRGYRKDNQNMDNRRNWQQDEEKQNKHSTQHVLETTTHKQTKQRKQDTSAPTNNWR